MTQKNLFVQLHVAKWGKSSQTSMYDLERIFVPKMDQSLNNNGLASFDSEGRVGLDTFIEWTLDWWKG